MHEIWSYLAKLSGTLTAWGPWGILVLGFIDSAGIPVAIGMDVLVVAVSAKAPELAFLAASMAVLGSMGGNLLLFFAARKGFRRFVAAVPEPGRSLRFRLWFNRYGLATVFIPALVPIPLPLKVFVISAGALFTSARSFILVVLVARVLRYGGEAWLGVRLGEESGVFLTRHMRELGAFAALLFVAIYVLLRFAERRRQT